MTARVVTISGLSRRNFSQNLKTLEVFGYIITPERDKLFASKVKAIIERMAPKVSGNPGHSLL